MILLGQWILLGSVLSKLLLSRVELDHSDYWSWLPKSWRNTRQSSSEYTKIKMRIESSCALTREGKSFDLYIVNGNLRY